MNGENLRCREAVGVDSTVPMVVDRISMQMEETEKMLSRVLEIVQGPTPDTEGMGCPETVGSLWQVLGTVERKSVKLNTVARELLSHFEKI